MKKAASWLRALCAVRRCQVCGLPLAGRKGALCPACFDELRPAVEPVCPVCLLPLPVTEVCGFCLERPRPWKRGAFYGVYAGRLRDLLLAYKFSGRLEHGTLLRFFLRQACLSHHLSRPDLILPVPMAPASLRQRGYNQAWELCRGLARTVGGKESASFLRKIRSTPVQAALSREERRRNLAGAFEALPLSAERVLLVDDVLTTGSTLEECARTCLRAGASSVEVLVLARA